MKKSSQSHFQLTVAVLNELNLLHVDSGTFSKD